LLGFLPGLAWNAKRGTIGNFIKEDAWPELRKSLGQYPIFWLILFPVMRWPRPIALLWYVMARVLAALQRLSRFHESLRTMNRLVQILRHEHGWYRAWALLRFVVEQLVGRLHALVLGWPRSYLGPGGRVIGSSYITVGQRAHINRYAWLEAVYSFRGQAFEPSIRIGQRFSASDRLHISCIGKIDIGDDCLFGSGVYISDHNHGVYSGPQHSVPAQPPVDRELQSMGAVHIGSRVWIGDNVVIVGPLTIGDGAVIGANSVVKKDVPGNVLAAGMPVQVIKRFNPASGRWEKDER